jgi:hypothetical protein
LTLVGVFDQAPLSPQQFIAWALGQVANGLVESFNGKVQDECLNERLFRSYRHARKLIAD